MVHSTKHIVQFSIATAAAGTQDILTLVNAVAVGSKNIPSEIEEGNSVKACYFEMWVRSSEANNGSIISVLWKQSGGGTNFSLTEMAQLYDADQKKNILVTQQGLVNATAGDAIRIFGGWYKIPKSKQRFGLGDKLLFQIFAQGAIDVVHCGVAIYKEYS